MLNQGQFDSLLIPVIYHHMDVGINMVPSLRGRLFNVQDSSLAEERGTSMGGMSVDAWDQWGKTRTKGRMDFDQLFSQSYVHVEYPVEIVIAKNLIINDQYGRIQRIIQQVGISAEQKMETDAASLLNNAFSDKWSDGRTLCATNHPKSGTPSNKGTDALTKENLSATRIAMMNFEDDRGNKIGVMPDELWVPPELEDTALELVNSQLDPASGNNAANPQAGRWTVVPWLRLEDTDNWFVVSSMWRQMAANWYNREAMEIMTVQETTTEIVYEVKLHYSFGVDDWRWIYGHEVST